MAWMRAIKHSPYTGVIQPGWEQESWKDAWAHLSQVFLGLDESKKVAKPALNLS
jgi:hypothetical protein